MTSYRSPRAERAVLVPQRLLSKSSSTNGNPRKLRGLSFRIFRANLAIIRPVALPPKLIGSASRSSARLGRITVVPRLYRGIIRAAIPGGSLPMPLLCIRNQLITHPDRGIATPPLAISWSTTSMSAEARRARTSKNGKTAEDLVLPPPLPRQPQTFIAHYLRRLGGHETKPEYADAE